MENVPEPTPMTQPWLYRPNHVILSGPPQELDRSETILEKNRERLRAAGIADLVRIPPPEPTVFVFDQKYWRPRKPASDPGSRWAGQRVETRDKIPPGESRLYTFKPLHPGVDALFAAKELSKILDEQNVTQNTTTCIDSALINPEEGGPSPEEGGPSPEEGGPSPEEGGPSPGSDWPGDIIPSPGKVKPEKPLEEQYAFWRTGWVAARNQGSSETGAGVTVVILDCFPFFDGRLDADNTYLDAFVLFPIDENAKPGQAEEAEDECRFSRRPPPTPQPKDPDLLAFDEVLPYHGTLIASLIRKIAPQARIIGVRVINNHGLTYTSDLAHAIQWLLANPVIDGQPLLTDRVVFNLSLGLKRTQKEIVESCCMFYTIHNAAARGAWFVCAAGNDSEWRPENPTEPSAYGFFSDSEATAARVIPVAGTHKPTVYSRFSNESAFAAPSTGIVMDPGPSQLKTKIGNTFVRWHGTSFSTPQVTGLLALLLSRATPPDDPKQHIWQTSHPPQRWNGVPEICFSNALLGVSCEQEESTNPDLPEPPPPPPVDRLGIGCLGFLLGSVLTVTFLGGKK